MIHLHQLENKEEVLAMYMVERVMDVQDNTQGQFLKSSFQKLSLQKKHAHFSLRRV